MFGDFHQSVRGGSIDYNSYMRQVSLTSNQLKRQAQHKTINKLINSNAASKAGEANMHQLQ